VQIAEQEILIVVARHLFIVVELRRIVIVASQLYNVADVQFTVEWTE